MNIQYSTQIVGQCSKIPPSLWGRPGSFLYAVVTVDDPKFVKFGIAKNPKKRFSSIQTCCPYALRLEATLPHYANLERDVHGNLKNFNVRGEWYIGCDAILRAVEIMKGGDVHLFTDYVDQLSYESDPDYPDPDYWGDRGETFDDLLKKHLKKLSV